jgi:hypothetical protein
VQSKRKKGDMGMDEMSSQCHTRGNGYPLSGCKLRMDTRLRGYDGNRKIFYLYLNKLEQCMKINIKTRKPGGKNILNR